jgi:hypothetical protein
MTADRIALIVCLAALFAQDALPAMTREERKAAVFAREARVDACMAQCRENCMPRATR